MLLNGELRRPKVLLYTHRERAKFERAMTDIKRQTLEITNTSVFVNANGSLKLRASVGRGRGYEPADVRMANQEEGRVIGSLLLVLIVELLNSAIEAIVERVGHEHHEEL